MKDLDLAKKIAVVLQKGENPSPEDLDALRKSDRRHRVIPDKKGRGWLFYDRPENELYHLEAEGDECTAYVCLDWDRLLAVERMAKAAPGKRDLVMAAATASLIKADDLREKAKQVLAAAS